MGKTVGAFGRKLDLKSVHQPHYQPGLVLCSLGLKDKFILFLRDTYDPVTFLAAGFESGIDQGIGRDQSFGGGAQGYAKRFGAEFVDQTSFKFFKDFAFPTIFGEDPRYYRMMEGPRKARLLHAVGHTFITHTDNGEPMFNFSEWLGTVSVVTLSNEYHPGTGAASGRRREACHWRWESIQGPTFCASSGRISRGNCGCRFGWIRCLRRSDLNH